jgi:hypothetical protein
MREDLIRLIIAAAVSLLLLIGGLYALLHGTTDGVEKAAIGWIGVITGYWLK